MKAKRREGDMMKESQKMIEELVKALPPEIQGEVRDFVEFLMQRRLKRRRQRPTFDWSGALKELRDQYTSVDLQHKISEWRIGG